MPRPQPQQVGLGDAQQLHGHRPGHDVREHAAVAAVAAHRVAHAQHAPWRAGRRADGRGSDERGPADPPRTRPAQAAPSSAAAATARRRRRRRAAPRRPARRTPIATSDSTPSSRSTATDASASPPRAVTRDRPYARAASPPTPAGRKLPTNELTRKMRAACAGRSGAPLARSSSTQRRIMTRAIERDQRAARATRCARLDARRRPARRPPCRSASRDRRGSRP